MAYQYDAAKSQFIFNGKPVSKNDTAKSLGMKNGATIILEPTTTTVIVVDLFNKSLRYRLPRFSKLKKFMDEFKATPPTNVFGQIIFMAKGNQIKESDTPDGLGLKDGDVVDVQIGRGGSSGVAHKPQITDLTDTANMKNTIHLVVKEDQGQEVKFQITRTTQLRNLMRSWIEYKGECRGGLCEYTFLYDGTRMMANETPKSLKMADGDHIRVTRRQEGC